MVRVQSILQYNGGAVVAMTGKNCVAIASDLRYGDERRTLAGNFPKVRGSCALADVRAEGEMRVREVCARSCCC
jgi:hypothetical protein